ncbi:MAG TPA: class I SAM-dependent methyltransferase [Alphaproteobacteria bacterium]|nr:class I SAM-dependent methyltransferase [Alphaproteobacteria bacterium]
MGYREHYESLLARHYSWMSGPFAEKAAAEKARLLEMGVRPGGLAADLGSGPGYQAAALADLGFARVLALDTSAVLLDELRRNLRGAPVEPVEADILQIADHVGPGTADCVTCMGDTLPHMPSRDAVTALFRAVHTALKPGGVFVLTWRDLTAARVGAERFLMPRADDDCILSCFLETVDEDRVRVHDIVHARADEGWTMQVSAYEKLRLSATWVSARLEACGLSVVKQQEAGGFVAVVAARERLSEQGKTQ